MADYIEREKALAFQDELEPCLCLSTATNELFSATKDADLVAYLQGIPCADVRPVARGYWHAEGDGYADGELVYDMWQCSCCGEWFDEWDDKPTWNFCPNCGADMRGGAGA